MSSENDSYVFDLILLELYHQFNENRRITNESPTQNNIQTNDSVFEDVLLQLFNSTNPEMFGQNKKS